MEERSHNTNNSQLTKFALGLMTLLSIGVALYALAFQARFVGDPAFHARFDQIFLPSSMHVIGGGIVLLIGGLQFWRSLRQGYPKIHRILGRTYLTFVMIGGVGGLIIAPQSDGGLVASFGFGLLAIVWLFTGMRAYIAIRNGQIQIHQEWMMRNFSLTFGAVTLRIYLGLFQAFGIPFEECYPVTAWISWVVNLLLVEWYLTLKKEKQTLKVHFSAPISSALASD